MKNLVTITLLGLLSFAAKAQLIISQYYENASNKYIEVTNIGSTVIDFSATPMYLCLFSNEKGNNPSGIDPSFDTALSGTLATGATLLLKKSGATLPTYAANTAITAIAVNQNGDDLVLISSTNDNTAWANRLDVIGNGTDWGADISYHRAPNTGPNTTYTPSEWVAKTLAEVANAGSSDIEYLGFHIYQVVPVELMHFGASQTEEFIELEWTTATEENNRVFEVERSADGRRFETIGAVAGAGTTYETQHYRFQDAQPLNGINYYRLKQIDFDGAFEYSIIISSIWEATAVRLYPNPVNAVLNLENAEGVGIIFNKNGQPLQTFEINSTQFQVELDLPKGIYILQLQQKNGVFIKKQFLKN